MTNNSTQSTTYTEHSPACSPPLTTTNIGDDTSPVAFTLTDIPHVGDDGKTRQRRYSRTDRGRESIRAKRERERESRYINRPFVFWDGEGITIDSGEHLYTSLANSRGARLRDDTGLHCFKSLEFLLANADPDAIHVVYGGSYDFNMWLTGLSPKHIEQLYRTGYVRFGPYKISWLLGKWFQVKHRDGRKIRINDVVSFFQKTFVAACIEYLGEDFPHRDLIERNKAKRGAFTIADNAEVDEYNDAELEVGVQLMTELRERLYRVGLRPTRWDGPGAIATALLKREGVQDGMCESSPDISRAARFGYAGGRFEVFQFGSNGLPVWEYDINSAYPHALRYVPNLNRGKWQRVSDAPSSEHTFGIYRVYYEAKPNGLPQPFWGRGYQGNVLYPHSIVNWYWSPEVIAGMEYVNEYGGELKVLDGWEFVPDNSDDKPFSFVPEMFAERRALKKAGDGAHYGIKLGLNSLYGKTCQRVGARLVDGVWRVPPYHQLEWAGYVTSFCRAMLLRACIGNMEQIIAFETDAMFSSVPLDLPLGSDLGEWEETVFESIHYGQSGFYAGEKSLGYEIGYGYTEKVVKTRGVDRGSVDYHSLSSAIQRGGKLAATQTRFIGAGLALQLNDWSKWRRWITAPKEIAMEPMGKRVHYADSLCPGCQGKGYHWTVIPAPGETTMLSHEHPIPWINPNEDMTLLDEMHDRGREEYGEYDF